MHKYRSGRCAAATADRISQPLTEARITDLATTLGVVGLLTYWSLTLIAPFAIIMIWAIILAVALFPAYAALRKLFGCRGGVAAILGRVVLGVLYELLMAWV